MLTAFVVENQARTAGQRLDERNPAARPHDERTGGERIGGQRRGCHDGHAAAVDRRPSARRIHDVVVPARRIEGALVVSRGGHRRIGEGGWRRDSRPSATGSPRQSSTPARVVQAARADVPAGIHEIPPHAPAVEFRADGIDDVPLGDAVERQPHPRPTKPDAMLRQRDVLGAERASAVGDLRRVGSTGVARTSRSSNRSTSGATDTSNAPRVRRW